MALLRQAGSSPRLPKLFEGLIRKGEDGEHLIAADGGKIVEELVERDAGSQVLQQRFNRNAGPREHGRATDYLGELCR